jgi:hypothetical protein
LWSLSPPIVFGIDDSVLPSAVDGDARSRLSFCRLCEKGSSRGKDVGAAGSLRLYNAYDNGRAVKDSEGAREQDGADVEVTNTLSSLLMADAVPGGRVSMDHSPAVPRGLACL